MNDYSAKSREELIDDLIKAENAVKYLGELVQGFIDDFEENIDLDSLSEEMLVSIKLETMKREHQGLVVGLINEREIKE